MPSYLEKGTSQHPTDELNMSWLVTKVRWVVEGANGRIKHWRLLDKVMHNHYVTSIGDFVRIVCAICNDNRPPLLSLDAEGEALAQQMRVRARMENHVKCLVEEGNLVRRRSKYEAINSFDLTDFPVLTMDDLRDLTMEVYQLKQAPQYTREHIEPEYELFLVKDDHNLISCKIQSRHTNSAVHTLWVEFSSSNVTGWYCTCKIGARTVGCCAHVASVVWYLGYQRYSEMKSTQSSKFLSAVTDASDLPVTDNESDNDSAVEE